MALCWGLEIWALQLSHCVNYTITMFVCDIAIAHTDVQCEQVHTDLQLMILPIYLHFNLSTCASSFLR